MGYLITNVKVLDGTGRQPFAGAVRVEGNRIAEVIAGPAAPVAAGATVINGGGARSCRPRRIPRPIGLSEHDFYELTGPSRGAHAHQCHAKTMLDCATRARSPGRAQPRLCGPQARSNPPLPAAPLAMARRSPSRRLVDSTLLPCTTTNPTFSGGRRTRRDPPVAGSLAREGVDLLKLNLSGDIGTSSFPSEQTPMTDAEVAAAMEVARSAELRVAAHCRSAESVLRALRHGVEVIYHANWADERALDALEAAPRRIFVGPRSAHKT